MAGQSKGPVRFQFQVVILKVENYDGRSHMLSLPYYLRTTSYS